MRVYDQSIREFLAEASSGSPVPGGGSIAALAAALGASMGSMTACLTTGAKFKEQEAAMLENADLFRQAIVRFESLQEKDMASFSRFMKALKLPASTSAEKEARSLAIREASAYAADVPLELMEACLGVMRRLAALAPEVNKNVVSDLGIAVLMLEAAVQSAWITVEINLNTMSGDSRNVYRDKGMLLLRESEEIKRNALVQVRERI
ncbi:cyclodeaminase/cyclohydrolase family protein [Paenibacillus chitinolyticus]|uniref:cyclodeaminase/cyclohydrolase family protein n=1 Tax=Paenibacillus chitinolyticus TaxID=79263 RepID=UPI001C44D3B1|nr:cyclodeaminase/cyclohydrolase family protein [Paenibacillus chitinolyticus]MBV6713252.1 cyclodeaminase/cyclohydrolase family protein [Paenibacillus chitinolyticus]